jgi:hypothetical protein
VATDPANCGGCGKTCSGGVCANGTCGPAPADIGVGASPTALAIDGTNVYWANDDVEAGFPTNQGTIALAPLAGSAPTVLASGRQAPAAIAVDATAVYWVDGGTGSADGSVNKVPIGGGAVTTLASGISPTAIALDATNVYFATVSASGTGRIARVPKAGGAVTVLTYFGVYMPWTMAIDGLSVYWIDGGDNSSAHGGVYKIPLDGGSPTALASGEVYGRGLAIDASSAYFTTRDAIKKVPLGGGAATTVATAPNVAVGLADLAIDANDVFFTATGDQDVCAQYRTGTVAKVPIAGGGVTTLATQQALPSAIAVDGAKVYWAEWLGNRVHSMSK